MLHIIFNKLGKEKQSFDTEKRLNREGSHSYAEKLISIELAKKSHSDFKWYQKNFPELKKMREDADYTEIATTSDKCRDALRRSETLISTLRNNFK